MVYYFTSNVVSPSAFIYVGKDKFENEDLIKHGLEKDVCSTSITSRAPTSTSGSAMASHGITSRKISWSTARSSPRQTQSRETKRTTSR
ncbi:Putative DUF814 domain protein [Aspergillus calidoustus]|uniref:Putative DUF814 domain protein n=1 Tax=Aspergillus calidoustus TaxID=454130 RepID=A0A0U5CQH5_ASPCI|nr:Putative DUF814 domain protein [Aspergillus calidoustus]